MSLCFQSVLFQFVFGSFIHISNRDAEAKIIFASDGGLVIESVWRLSFRMVILMLLVGALTGLLYYYWLGNENNIPEKEEKTILICAMFVSYISMKNNLYLQN